MLSSLPKLADKAFILGFLIPTLLFALTLVALFSDQGWAESLIKALTEKDGLEKFAYLVLGIWSCSVLLMMLNHIQFQFLEGYLWPVSTLSVLKDRQLKRFKKSNERFDQLNEDWHRLGKAFPKTDKAEYESLRRKLLREFPTEDTDLHLPTRFGNAIRAFEVYSKETYGADSIPLWLHLSTVIPKEYQSALDDARAQVNCAVNICFFAAIVVLMALGRVAFSADISEGLCTMLASIVFPPVVWFALTALSAMAVCYLSYLLSLQLVYAWGDLVKAAFDCYLPALAEKLGYKLPETGEERKIFWKAISDQAIYGIPVLPEQWKHAEKKAPPNADAYAKNELMKLLNSIFR